MKNVADQASDVPIQLHIVEIVACSIHLPWVQLCRVLHVKDCLELKVLTSSLIIERVLEMVTFCLKEALSSKPSLASAVYTWNEKVEIGLKTKLLSKAAR